MPNDDAIASFVIGLMLGLVLMFAVGVTVSQHYKNKAVKNGAAQYNSNTGEFEWKEVNDAK